MYVQVHVSDILNITSRRKRIQNMELYFETYLGCLQMFSYLSNGKLQPATILRLFFIEKKTYTKHGAIF